jgi:UDP-N-acetylmuramoyl-L-alanyl-D-glutamate--2,6-diaminopimelate ligase
VTQILDDMLAGLNGQQQRLRVEPDRRLAIRQVVNQASAQDIVVIAGKGHETYQEIEGVRHWFDDVVELRAALGLNSAPPPSYPA